MLNFLKKCTPILVFLFLYIFMRVTSLLYTSEEYNDKYLKPREFNHKIVNIYLNDWSNHYLPNYVLCGTDTTVLYSGELFIEQSKVHVGDTIKKSANSLDIQLYRNGKLLYHISPTTSGWRLFPNTRWSINNRMKAIILP